MADLVTIARPYAQAVFALAKDKGTIGRWSETLQLLSLLMQDVEAAKLLHSPTVAGESKVKFVLDLLSVRLDAEAQNLVQVLVDNGRMALLPEIYKLYEASRQKHEGQVEALVITAFALTADQQQNIVAALKRRHGCDIVLHSEIDASLLGGVIIQAAGEVIDGSVRGQLDQLATALR